MKFSQYLSLYRVPCPLEGRDTCTLEYIYNTAKKYLPTLPPAEEVEYEGFSAHRPGVMGYVRKPEKEGEPLRISFRHDPPDLTTFYHEIIHLAQLNGGKEANEIEAWNYPGFLHYAIRKSLPSFDLLKISELTMKDVEEVLQSLNLGISTIDDYLWQVGVFPPVGWEQMKEEDRLVFFFAELSAGLDAEEPLAVMIFERLAEKLRR